MGPGEVRCLAPVLRRLGVPGPGFRDHRHPLETVDHLGVAFQEFFGGRLRRVDLSLGQSRSTTLLDSSSRLSSSSHTTTGSGGLLS